MKRIVVPTVGKFETRVNNKGKFRKPASIFPPRVVSCNVQATNISDISPFFC